MKYTFEQKLGWVRDWMDGKHVETPPGITRERLVELWVKLYRASGPAGLAHRMLRMTAKEKEAAVMRVLDGEPQVSVAASLGMSDSGASLMRWRRIYLTDGIAGLRALAPGRRPTVPGKKKEEPEAEPAEGTAEYWKRKYEAERRARELDDLKLEYEKKLSSLVRKQAGRRTARRRKPSED
jgi:transposase